MEETVGLAGIGGSAFSSRGAARARDWAPAERSARLGKSTGANDEATEAGRRQSEPAGLVGSCKEMRILT